MEINRNGEIIQSFSCSGEGDSKIGYKLSGLGYLNEESIGIISEKGLYQFKRNGEMQSFIADPESMTRYNDTKLYSVNQENGRLIIGTHHSFEGSELGLYET